MTSLPLSPPGRPRPPGAPLPLVVIADVPPVLATEHPVVEIPIRLCRPSSTQPRRGKLDVATLQEDIRKHGLLQSIWVRTKAYSTPDPITRETTYYEIAFGHRREFACRLLGHDTIRAEVHDELTDRQVFEMQLSENREHAPLTELEEADAIALYMRPEAEGGFGVTEVTEVAARLGLSESTVYRRIGLARLVQAGRAALDEGKLYLASAYAIASIRDPAGQEEALAEILDGGGPTPVRTVLSIVESRYHLQLLTGQERAFDPADASLIPTAGACTICPKRAGAEAQAELFPTETDEATRIARAKSRAERCTDRACFHRKVEAGWARRREDAAATHTKIVEGQEGHRLVPGGTFFPGNAPGYVCSTSRVTDDPQGRTWGELIGGKVPASVIVRDAADHVHLLLEENAARRELDELRGKTRPGQLPALPAADRPSGEGEAYRPPAPAAEPPKAEPPKKPVDPIILERKAEERGGAAALKAIGETVARRQLGVKASRAIAALAIHVCHQGAEAVATVLEVAGGWKGLLAWVDEQKDVDALRGVLVQVLAASHGLFGSGEELHPLALASRAWDVDLPGCKADALKELKKLAKKGTPIGGAAPRKRAKPAAVPAPDPAAPADTTAAASAKTGPCERCGDPCPAGICAACTATSDVLLEILANEGPRLTWEDVLDAIEERTGGPIESPRLDGVRDAMVALGVILYEPGEGEADVGVYSLAPPKPPAPAAAPPAPVPAEGAAAPDALAREAVLGLVTIRNDPEGIPTREIVQALDGRLPPKRTLAAVRELLAEKQLMPVAGPSNRVRLPVPATSESV